MSHYFVSSINKVSLRDQRIVAYESGHDGYSYWFQITGEDGPLHNERVTEGELFFKLWVLCNITHKVTTIDGEDTRSLPYLVDRLRVGAPI